MLLSLVIAAIAYLVGLLGKSEIVQQGILSLPWSVESVAAILAALQAAVLLVGGAIVFDRVAASIKTMINLIYQ